MPEEERAITAWRPTRNYRLCSRFPLELQADSHYQLERLTYKQKSKVLSESRLGMGNLLINRYDSCTKEITLQRSGSCFSGWVIASIRVEIDICLWFVSGRNLALLIFILLWVQEPPATSSSSSQRMQMSRFMQVRLQSSLHMRHVKDTEENMENHIVKLSRAIQ